MSHRQESDWFHPRSEHTLATYILQQKQKQQNHEDRPHSITILPKPWIHIGMPKTGTTTLEHFWKCGLNRPPPYYDDDHVSHSTCKVTSQVLRDRAFEGKGLPPNPSRTHCPSHTIEPCKLCGSCMKWAKNFSLPLLASCGNYTAWAQLDTEEACSFPQLTALNEIHNEAPTATLIVMFRRMDTWISSVKNFKQGFMMRRLRRCHPLYWQGRNHLQEWFGQVIHHARQFASTHPSHTYIEMDLDDPQTSALASQAFGINASCWGRHNVNARIHRNVTTNPTSSTSGSTQNEH